VILAAVFVGVLGVHGYKQFKIRQQRRISEGGHPSLLSNPAFNWNRLRRQSLEVSKVIGT
jgi:hypothetical protein